MHITEILKIAIFKLIEEDIKVSICIDEKSQWCIIFNKNIYLLLEISYNVLKSNIYFRDNLQLKIGFNISFIKSINALRKKLFYMFIDFILVFYFRFYLFIFREGKGGREGEKHHCVVASHVPPTGGPGLLPRHAPWLGIQPASLWIAGQWSIHRVTPARVLRKKLLTKGKIKNNFGNDTFCCDVFFSFGN